MKTEQNDLISQSIILSKSDTIQRNNENETTTENFYTGGLTKREYFAVCALNTMCMQLNSTGNLLISSKSIAEKAVGIADELILALNSEDK